MSDFQTTTLEQQEEVDSPEQTQLQAEQLTEVLETADDAFEHIQGRKPSVIKG